MSTRELNCFNCGYRIPSELIEEIIARREIYCENCGSLLQISDFPELVQDSKSQRVKEHKEKDLISRIADRVNEFKDKIQVKIEEEKNKTMDEREKENQQYRNLETPQATDRYVGTINNLAKKRLLDESDKKKIQGAIPIVHVISNIITGIVFMVSMAMMVDMTVISNSLEPVYLVILTTAVLILDNLFLFPKYRKPQEIGLLGLDEFIVGIALLSSNGLGIPYLIKGILILIDRIDTLHTTLCEMKGRNLGEKESTVLLSTALLKFILEHGTRIAFGIIGLVIIRQTTVDIENWELLIPLIIITPISFILRSKFVLTPLAGKNTYHLTEKELAAAYIGAVISMMFGYGFLFLFEAILLSILREHPKDLLHKFFEEMGEDYQNITNYFLGNQKDNLILIPEKLSNESSKLPIIRPILSDQEPIKKYPIQLPQGEPIKRFDPETGKPLDEFSDPKKQKEYIEDFGQRIFTVLSEEVRKGIIGLDIDESEKMDMLRSFVFLTEEEQLRYIEEIREANGSANSALIARIMKLHFDQKQTDFLINQLDYLNDTEQVKFVEEIEKAARKASA